MALIQKISRTITQNSPAFMTALGVVGVFTTAILTAKAMPEAQRRVWDAESEQTTDLSNLDKVKLTWTLFIPSALSASLSVVCIIGANSINKRRNAALLSVYALSETALKEYQSKVSDSIGEKAEQSIRDNLNNEKFEKALPSNTIVLTEESEVLCYDTFSGRFFKNNIESIRRAENDVNRQIINDFSASLNDFYRLIGLPPIDVGDDIGWNNDKPLELLFTSRLDGTGKPAAAVDYRIRPYTKYDRVFG